MNLPATVSRLKVIALTLMFVAAATFYFGASAQAATATLSWSAPTTNVDGSPATGLAGYKLHIGTQSGYYVNTIDVGNVTSYTDSTLNDGSTYYFAVSAYNTAGLESANSAEVSKNFPVLTYTITATAGTGGSITALNNTKVSTATNSTSTISSVTVTAGASQSFSITPATGYATSDVKVDGTSMGAVSSYTFNSVTANHTISATFAAKTVSYSITATAGTGGSISPSGTTSVNSGLSQSYTITPATGYAVSGVTVDGASVGAVTTYTFSNVTANHTIAASFASSASSSTGSTGSTTGTITGTTTWQNRSFTSQSGVFTVGFDMTPAASSIDAVTMLSSKAAAAFTDGAAIVKFDPSGTMMAMKSTAYAADAAVPYSAGKTYHVRMVVNVPSHVYDVYVTPAGGTQVHLAAAYPFRSTQATATSLANLAVYAGTGSDTVGNITAPSPVITGSTTWQNAPFASKSGTFTASFDMIPAANNMDGVTMLSNGAATAFTSGAALVRFDQNGTITAMKSSTYTADVAVPYSAGNIYHVRMVVNVSSHVYDVYVTPPTGTEVHIATAYPFRSTQATVTALSNVGIYSGIASHRVMNIVVQ